MITEIQKPEKVAHLFEGWQETIIWSCLQQVMGHLYAPAEEEPVSAAACLGVFCFFAGEPDRDLILNRPETMGFQILVPQNSAWEEMIEACYGARARKTVRYAIKKEPEVFDRELLHRAAGTLPAGFTIRLMDREWFERCGKIRWCSDWVSMYESYESYEKYGLGVIILHNGVPVAGASSYSSFRGGIEIEIDTREDYRRQGLAYAAGARLILECLERGWYPSWDAQNLWSAALAQKLGYHFDHEYVVYEISKADAPESRKEKEENRIG